MKLAEIVGAYDVVRARTAHQFFCLFLLSPFTFTFPLASPFKLYVGNSCTLGRRPVLAAGR